MKRCTLLAGAALGAPMAWAGGSIAMKYLKLVFVLWCLACSSLASAMYFDQESGLNYNGYRSYRPPDGRYTQPDPIGLEGGWNRINYAYQNPLLFSDPFGLDVFLCSQPAFGIPWNPIDHHWLKTDTVEAGMGGTRGNVPGNDSGDMPGDPVTVVDHAGRSAKPGASCKKIEGVDEQKVNEALRLNRSLGRWGPTNQCQSFARRTLLDAGWQPAAPPYISNPLPTFGY